MFWVYKKCVDKCMEIYLLEILLWPLRSLAWSELFFMYKNRTDVPLVDAYSSTAHWSVKSTQERYDNKCMRTKQYGLVDQYLLYDVNEKK